LGEGASVVLYFILHPSSFILFFMLHNFTIYRGLTFAGLRLLALDASGAAVTISAGTTGLLQARSAPGKALAFELPVELGEATGEILISEVAASVTAEFPIGLYAYALILISSDGKPWPPILCGQIAVSKAVTQPA
jgi:hypothetical protein